MTDPPTRQPPQDGLQMATSDTLTNETLPYFAEMREDVKKLKGEKATGVLCQCRDVKSGG